jgi:hypothetical protein
MAFYFLGRLKLVEFTSGLRFSAEFGVYQILTTFFLAFDFSRVRKERISVFTAFVDNLLARNYSIFENLSYVPLVAFLMVNCVALSF